MFNYSVCVSRRAAVLAALAWLLLGPQSVFALPQFTEVARKPMSSGKTPVAIAVNDSGDVCIMRDSDGPHFAIERWRHDAAAATATYTIAYDTTGLAAISGTRFGWKGDTLLAPLNYRITAWEAPRGILRLYQYGGTSVAEWGSQYFPRAIEGSVFSGGLIWVGLEGAYAFGPTPCKPPRLQSFRQDRTPVDDIVLKSSAGDSCGDIVDLCPGADSSIVVLFAAGSQQIIRRYGPDGTVMGSSEYTNDADHSISAIWESRSGILYAQIPYAHQFVAYDRSFTEIERFGGEDTAIGPTPGTTFFSGDLDCRIYHVRLNEGSGDTLWVLSHDADGDDICDCWETYGLRYSVNHSPLILPDASVGQKDVYVELDAMEHHVPTQVAIDSVVAVFGRVPVADLPLPHPDGLAAGIALHIAHEYDQALPDTVWTGTDPSSVSEHFRAAKLGAFGDPAERSDPALLRAKALVYRYCLSVHQLSELRNRSGKAEVNVYRASGWSTTHLDSIRGGNDFVIAPTGEASSPDAVALNDTTTAAIVMHELGHTLGLLHGGQDRINFKPNYRSIMNYDWVVPHKRTRDEWRLDYSHQPFTQVLDETGLEELLGIGGTNAEWHAYLGPVVSGTPNCGIRFLSVNKKLDFDRTGFIDNEPVSANINQRPTPTSCGIQGPDHADDVLFPASDWDRLKFISRYWPYWKLEGEFSGAAMADGDLPMTDIFETHSGPLDCDGDGVIDSLQIAAGALDIDANGIPDECDRDRILGLKSTYVVCPAADGDTLRFDVDLSGVQVVDIDDAGLVVKAMRLASLSDPLWTWRPERGAVPLDTLVGTYSSGAHTAHFAEARISGCGEYAFRVFGGSTVLSDTVVVEFRSVDRNVLSIGSVDRFDSTAVVAAVGGSPADLCADFTLNGQVTSADTAAFYHNHGRDRHHLPRKLLVPNGGGVYVPGEVFTILWVRGRGDSARATLNLIRDSESGLRRELVGDMPDTGSYSWTVPSYLTGATDYRVEVVHSAGYYHVDNHDVGRDSSDTPFEITWPSGGGCPFVDTRTSEGWQVENSVLARSASGTPGEDAYRLKATPSLVDGKFTLRLRENEQEYTTLDRVMVKTVDHAPGVRVFAFEERVVVGTRTPAHRVLTVSGQDVTRLVSGSGGYYAGQPGDTLLVDMAPPLADNAFAIQSTEGGGGGGDMEGGEKEMEKAYGALRAGDVGPRPVGAGASIDEEILNATGIVVEAPDGAGGWRPFALYYPRASRDDAAIDSLGNGSFRLIFKGRHRLYFIGRIEPSSTERTEQTLHPVMAQHSRLGNVLSAVGESGGGTTNLIPGDTLSLQFEAGPTPGGLVREWILLTNGNYTSVPPLALQPVTEAAPLPMAFALRQNHPNPFSGQTTIRFELPVETHVRLTVFDAQGRLVRSLADGRFAAGFHALDWDERDARGKQVGSGVYLYRIQAGSFRDQKKMVLLPH